MVGVTQRTPKEIAEGLTGEQTDCIRELSAEWRTGHSLGGVIQDRDLHDVMVAGYVEFFENKYRLTEEGLSVRQAILEEGL